MQVNASKSVTRITERGVYIRTDLTGKEYEYELST